MLPPSEESDLHAKARWRQRRSLFDLLARSESQEPNLGPKRPGLGSWVPDWGPSAGLWLATSPIQIPRSPDPGTNCRCKCFASCGGLGDPRPDCIRDAGVIGYIRRGLLGILARPGLGHTRVGYTPQCTYLAPGYTCDSGAPWNQETWDLGIYTGPGYCIRWTAATATPKLMGRGTDN